MNIALIGYGRMGKEVEAVAKERGATILKIFTSKNNLASLGLTPEALHGVDVCIDFTTPAAVVENIKAVAEAKTNIVVGTTGWYDKLDEVKTLVKHKNIGLLYAPNFSIGVNVFYHIVAEAARLFDHYPEYDVALGEVHHRHKTDSPSGTALSLGSIIVRHMERKKEILAEPTHTQIQPHQLHVASTRVGAVTGTHAVLFDSECDSIELVHTAKNRRGFALGAVIAAEWLKGKKGMFTMRDVIPSGR